jgi:excisionase family DNA binding protein
LRKLLASQGAGDAHLKVIDLEAAKPTEVILSPALSDLLIELLRHAGNGDAVTIVPVTQMLTTQQAADILNVSRPFLISIIEKGELEFTPVGRHRRIKAEHLFEYSVTATKSEIRRFPNLPHLTPT